jgi:uncharacterized protein YeaO (DUF488 family)
VALRIRIKRVYDPKARAGGRRILVDRRWPRGFTRAAAGVDFWARNNATALKEYLETRPTTTESA